MAHFRRRDASVTASQRLKERLAGRWRFGPTPQYPPWQAAFSEEALYRAWLPIRANGGAAGGGPSIREFEKTLATNLEQLRLAALAGSYHPHPVKEILVPKSSDGWRPVTLWTVADRVMQRAVYNYLESVWNPCFLPCSFGFRPGRRTADAAQAIATARDEGARWVVDADIKDCFGQMDNGRILRLLQQWSTPEPIRWLIGNWLKARIANDWRGRKVAGTSQGGVISPLLCNLYLHGFDRAFQRREWRLVRYADDFVILTGDERTARSALRHASHTLRGIGLGLNESKTRLATFAEGFQFVGWFFVRNEIFELK